MRPIDIAPADLETVRCILREHAPGLEVHAFGSRVSWTARETSDLDIALLTEEPLSIARITNLKAVFTKSYLPFRVDIVDWASTSENFRKVIEREHVVVLGKEESPVIDGWCECSLGELTDNFDFIRVPVKKPDRRSGHYPYYGASGIVDYVDDYLFEGEYLLIAEDGENLRTRKTPIALLADGKFWVNNHAHIVRGNQKANTRYLMYALSDLDISGYLTGSTMPKLTKGNLDRISLLTPPLPEQRTIAQILGTLDDKIELNHRMNKTLEDIAQALFKSWFVDFEPVKAKLAVLEKGGTADEAERAAMRTISCKDEITLAKLENDESEVFVNLAQTAAQFPSAMQDSELGQIPEGWGIKPLDEVANFQNGLALQKFRPQNQEDRLPVVKIAQLRSGKTDSEEWSTANIRPECIIGDGDVIFSWSGSLMVKMWVGGRAALNQHLFKVTSINYPKWFYFYCVLSHLRDFQSIAAGKATTMGHIKRQHLSDALCVVPDINYLASVASFFAPILAAYVSTEIANRTLSTLRDSLLPKLISGEL